jgi:hypothetical protein
VGDLSAAGDVCRRWGVRQLQTLSPGSLPGLTVEEHLAGFRVMPESR